MSSVQARVRVYVQAVKRGTAVYVRIYIYIYIYIYIHMHTYMCISSLPGTAVHWRQCRGIRRRKQKLFARTTKLRMYKYVYIIHVDVYTESDLVLVRYVQVTGHARRLRSEQVRRGLPHAGIWQGVALRCALQRSRELDWFMQVININIVVLLVVWLILMCCNDAEMLVHAGNQRHCDK